MDRPPRSDKKHIFKIAVITILSGMYEHDWVLLQIVYYFIIFKVFESEVRHQRNLWLTYHEISNTPVEDCSIVVAFFTQTNEILSSFGHLRNILYTVIQESRPRSGLDLDSAKLQLL